MHQDGYFDEHVAARYDESEGGMFDPGLVDSVVEFLAELAGAGRALELDLMAQLAGMRSTERWSGWNREPFTSDSRTLIGVWEKPATDPAMVGPRETM